MVTHLDQKHHSQLTQCRSYLRTVLLRSFEYARVGHCIFWMQAEVSSWVSKGREDRHEAMTSKPTGHQNRIGRRKNEEHTPRGGAGYITEKSAKKKTELSAPKIIPYIHGAGSKVEQIPTQIAPTRASYSWGLWLEEERNQQGKKETEEVSKEEGGHCTKCQMQICTMV